LVQTILIVVAGWLALDALIICFLLLAGARRARRRSPQTDITEDLLAACPIGREHEAMPITARARKRFRPGTGVGDAHLPAEWPAVPTGSRAAKPE
jgi:hypothetical protein